MCNKKYLLYITMEDSEQEVTEESSGIIESADELPSSTKVLEDIDSDKVDTEFENINYDDVDDTFEYGIDEQNTEQGDS